MQPFQWVVCCILCLEGNHKGLLRVREFFFLPWDYIAATLALESCIALGPESVTWFHPFPLPGEFSLMVTYPGKMEEVKLLLRETVYILHSVFFGERQSGHKFDI